MNVIGWDIGGVHLKAARARDGRIVDALQLAAPLRAGLDPLRQAFAQALARMGDADLHAITMTAELADTFAARSDGVACIAALAADAVAGTPARLYAGRAGFVDLRQAAHFVTDIASANWHASAAWLARRCDSAILIDMGSTTTDLVPIAGGTIAARGYTDAERLAAGELVYTGLVRGFVMAAAARAPVGGRWMPLVNENFATMADVHRILGTLPEGADQMATADGRDKTVPASRARLARMVGCDAADADDAAWAALARWFAEAQMRSILDAAMLVISRGAVAADAPVVGAGIGSAMVSEAARRLQRGYVGFDRWLEAAPEASEAAARCAPAAALALLASAAT